MNALLDSLVELFSSSQRTETKRIRCAAYDKVTFEKFASIIKFSTSLSFDVKHP